MVANIHDAKTHFSEYLARALAGEEVIVAKAGKPVAKIVPIKPANPKKPRKRILGKYEGQGYFPDSAFAPMTDAELKEWYGSPLHT